MIPRGMGANLPSKMRLEISKIVLKSRYGCR
jgi:hypothetical protein